MLNTTMGFFDYYIQKNETQIRKKRKLSEMNTEYITTTKTC